ncbi:MAG TPA: hypothetical protein VK894_04915, partial [Jiangellales bacterium]|nr:hypothetical protein [Jiangellales bacterium]
MPHVGLAVPVVWSATCAQHGPGQRATAIRAAVLAAGATLVPADRHPDEAVLAVHEHRLLDYLRTASATLRESLPSPESTVAPDVFPTLAMLGAVPQGEPGTVRALAGRYCYDTSTPVRPGTWEAARGCVD